MAHLPQFDLAELGRRWPSAVVARGEIGRFSGGILNPRTMANMDSQGVGPPGRFYIGRKVVYPVTELIRWLQNRVTQPQSR